MPSVPPLHTWTLGDGIFTQNGWAWTTDNWYRGDTTLQFTDSVQQYSISFAFAQPPATGTYKVVYDPEAANEVGIQAWTSNTRFYSDDDGYFISVTRHQDTYQFKAASATLHKVDWVLSSTEMCAFNLSN